MTTHDMTSAASAPVQGTDVTSLVVCSLEPWGEVRRRLHIMVDEMVDLDPSLHVLYVAPSVDVPHRLARGEFGELSGPRLQRVHPRIHVLCPRKWAPRVLGGHADRSLERQVLDAVGELRLQRPLLWVNDAAYASFAVRSGWPTLYDVTDDWLEAEQPQRLRSRLEANDRLLVDRAEAVVVCSPGLARSRGRSRSVELIPNGVDVDLFRSPRPRPTMLPEAPVALYVGTLHSDRVDVPLVLQLAAARPDLQIVLAGPNCLPSDVTAQLRAVPTIHLLGPRPYEQVPALLQHADIVIVPHVVSPFTESLDPIKAYECLAVGRPTVATPVAGFRGLGAPVVTADRDHFIAAVDAALASAATPATPGSLPDTPVPSWRSRAESMAALMHRIRQDRSAA
jgi:glycosyltransferase involved in cell wall biosynthesis